MSKEKGYVSFVLHAHLPFVHHPESEDYWKNNGYMKLCQKHTYHYLQILKN